MMIDEYFLLPDGSTTTLAAVNPLLGSVPLWQAYPGDSLNGDFTNCFAPNRRALEVALTEAQFEVEDLRIVSMGGYARARAVVDERIEKYQRLDERLVSTPFDPSVPYFLDEPGAVQTVTGRVRAEERSDAAAPEQERGDAAPARPWWKFWRVASGSAVVVRAALVIALIVAIWLTFPPLLQMARDANLLRRLELHERRTHILGPLYPSIRELDRQLPPGKPVAIVFRNPSDADLGIYVNYFLYPRPTRHYHGLEAYQRDPQRPEAIAWIDRERAWDVRLVTLEQAIEESSR
jgi:hypothetical protein